MKKSVNELKLSDVCGINFLWPKYPRFIKAAQLFYFKMNVTCKNDETFVWKMLSKAGVMKILNKKHTFVTNDCLNVFDFFIKYTWHFLT